MEDELRKIMVIDYLEGNTSFSNLSLNSSRKAQRATDYLFDFMLIFFITIIILFMFVMTFVFLTEIWTADEKSSMILGYIIALAFCAGSVFAFRWLLKKKGKSEHDIYSSNGMEIAEIINQKLKHYNDIQSNLIYFYEMKQT